jgi:ribosomal protein S18 acetylase RimI-like enzyme
MLTIRLATDSDAELLADISRQTFYDTFAAQNTKENMDKFMNEQFTRELLMKEVKAPGNIFLIVYSDEKAVGYARLRENNNPPELKDPNALELSRIYAVSSHLGKGIGNMLMEKCIDIARQKGKSAVWLGVWKENERAIKFYKKWGFEPFAEHDFILGDDVQKDWLMVKNL